MKKERERELRKRERIERKRKRKMMKKSPHFASHLTLILLTFQSCLPLSSFFLSSPFFLLSFLCFFLPPTVFCFLYWPLKTEALSSIWTQWIASSEGEREERRREKERERRRRKEEEWERFKNSVRGEPINPRFPLYQLQTVSHLFLLSYFFLSSSLSSLQQTSISFFFVSESKKRERKRRRRERKRKRREREREVIGQISKKQLLLLLQRPRKTSLTSWLFPTHFLSSSSLSLIFFSLLFLLFHFLHLSIFSLSGRFTQV